MVFRILGLSFIFVSLMAGGQSRKPAVEDFVGIEIVEREAAPQGTEPLFNLEQDLNQLKNPKAAPTAIMNKTAGGWSSFSIMGLSMMIGLPLFLWFMVMAHLRKKASLENASNIAILEKYRKDREQNKKLESNIRKAS